MSLREREEIQALPRAVAAAAFGCFLVLGASALDLGAPVPAPIWSLSAPAQVTPGQPFEVTAEVTLPEGYYQDTNSEFLSFEPAPGTSVVGRASSAPDVRAGKPSFTGRFSLKRTVVLPSSTPTGPLSLSWTLGWQICQIDGVCLLPSHQTKPVTLHVAPASGQIPGWVGALAAAFLGGLILNVMPCVFPVLALKVMPRARSRRANWLFAAGTVGGLGLLGLVTAVAAWLGHRLDWGFSFQSPAFLWALALGFWLLVLRLWGLWSFHPVGMPTPRGSTWGPLAAGAAFVLTAAPCTAPVLGPALGFALAQPPAVIPLFFLAVGAGMAAPLVLLTEIPWVAQRLPRPGPWLVWAERSAGALLVLTVAYVLWILAQRTSTLTAALGGAALLFVTPVVWWGARKPSRLRWGALGTLIAVLSAAVLAAPVHPVAEPPAPWGRYSAQALQAALDQGRPVFVDGTAAWCATCQVNEWNVLGQKEVLDRMKEGSVLLLRADFTRPGPEVQAWLVSVGRAGLPVYALYRPGQTPVIFPELLLKDDFLRQLDQIFSAKG